MPRTVPIRVSPANTAICLKRLPIGEGGATMPNESSALITRERSARNLAIQWGALPPTVPLRSLLAYWESRRNGHPMPARADLDPLHFPALMSRVMLVDVLGPPLDFRYRLVGTAAVERLGADYTGARFSELAYQTPSSLMFSFAMAITEARQPGWAEIRHVGPDLTSRTSIILAMPLSGDGQTVDMLLYGVDFQPIEEDDASL
jgi:hypothetical protein